MWIMEPSMTCSCHVFILSFPLRSDSFKLITASFYTLSQPQSACTCNWNLHFISLAHLIFDIFLYSRNSRIKRVHYCEARLLCLRKSWWRHQMETFSALLALWNPLTKASDAELWCFLWSAPEQTVMQTIDMPVIWDAIAFIMMSL